MTRERVGIDPVATITASASRLKEKRRVNSVPLKLNGLPATMMSGKISVTTVPTSFLVAGLRVSSTHSVRIKSKNSWLNWKRSVKRRGKKRRRRVIIFQATPVLLDGCR